MGIIVYSISQFKYMFQSVNIQVQPTMDQRFTGRPELQPLLGLVGRHDSTVVALWQRQQAAQWASSAAVSDRPAIVNWLEIANVAEGSVFTLVERWLGVEERPLRHFLTYSLPRYAVETVDNRIQTMFLWRNQ